MLQIGFVKRERNRAPRLPSAFFFGVVQRDNPNTLASRLDMRRISPASNIMDDDHRDFAPRKSSNQLFTSLVPTAMQTEKNVATNISSAPPCRDLPPQFVLSKVAARLR